MMHPTPRDVGWIEVVCGSMFSGKTEELIRRLRLAKIARQRVLVFKPRLDDRFAETEIVSRADVRLECRVVDSGCCGMAGSFGFEEAHYEVAQACGSRALLPAVSQAHPDTMVVTSGFSCREMIEQNHLPRPLHLAEVLQRALRSGTPDA